MNADMSGKVCLVTGATDGHGKAVAHALARRGADLVIHGRSREKVRAVHKKQLLTYLRLAKKPLGLLINFNETLLKDGISRIINDPPTES